MGWYIESIFRRGQLCGRCLRGMDTRNHDELSVLDGEEYDDISIAGSLINEQIDPEPVVQVNVRFPLVFASHIRFRSV